MNETLSQTVHEIGGKDFKEVDCLKKISCRDPRQSRQEFFKLRKTQSALCSNGNYSCMSVIINSVIITMTFCMCLQKPINISRTRVCHVCLNWLEDVKDFGIVVLNAWSIRKCLRMCE